MEGGTRLNGLQQKMRRRISEESYVGENGARPGRESDWFVKSELGSTARRFSYVEAFHHGILDR
jgi:hypothetical protein